ncbi:hypothetical protein AJ80_08659 [Polytolypa hystricis UAMH7299]|uniref:Uncharacterized protein n=1 Tax=Polytolypa hystricis (strain UAMH7299) TaxID=1447883 RepID=A0A2B7X4N9_POLH7|nr:hypothetical protein AJ80_08659 [Polytolypa hystricis UAMH7299]
MLTEGDFPSNPNRIVAFNFNSSASTAISGMTWPVVKNDDGEFVLHKDFFAVKPTTQYDGRGLLQSLLKAADLVSIANGNGIIDIAAPVGVRCSFLSEGGTATLDANNSFFSRLRPFANDTLC